jgi:hypothetical protein
MKYLLIILGLLHNVDAYSQREGHIWHFANYAGLDFNSGVAIPIPSKVHGNPPAYAYRLSNSTLCRSDGSLLFYENNIHPYPDSSMDHHIGIFDAQDQVVKKTSGNPNSYFFIASVYGTHFLPFRGTNKIAYVYVDIDNGSCINFMMLSDSLRNGMGGAIDSAVRVLSRDSIAPGGGGAGLACVRHANGRDWWVVGHEFLSDTFVTALFTPDTAFIVHKQQIGAFQGITGTSFTGGGAGNAMRFNSSGSQLVRGSGEGLIELYSFDRCTGLLSNVRTINPSSTSSNNFYMYDIAYSQNGRFVYAPIIGSSPIQGSWAILYQYDLLELDTSLIRAEVSKCVNMSGQFVGSSSFLSLAPDGKIYVNTYSISNYCRDSSYLSVINDPDVKVPACNFQFNGLYMDTLAILNPGLPHHPDYTIGPIDGSPCDTLGLDEYPPIVYSANSLQSEPVFVVYPNPAKDYLMISGKELESVQQVRLYSVQGRLLLSSEPEWLSGSQQILRIQGFNPGIYFLELDYGKGVYRQKVWVE